ncbi:MAG: hypothetical protein ABIH53_00945 [archaeon]
MAKRLVITVVLAFLLLVTVVSASGLSITHTGDNVVEIGGTVEFKVLVKNTGSDHMYLQVYPEPYASLPSSPIDFFSIAPKAFELNGFESKELDVKVRMKRTVMPRDNYATYLVVEDIEDPSFRTEHNLVMNIIPPDEVVSVSADFPKSVAPNEEFRVTVDFRNNMNVQLSNVEVYVGSELFEEKKNMILFPLQKRSQVFTFKLPPMAQPRDYEFSIRVYQNGVLNGRLSDTFVVSENSNVAQEVSVEDGFLSKTTTITKTNLGNAVATEHFNYPASLVTGMFVSSSVDEASSDGAGLHWIFDIQPGDKQVLQVTVSYVPLLIAFVVIVLFGAVAYYLLTRGLIIRKRVFKLRKGKDTAQFTVMLHIKNRTRGAVKDLTVFEILPKLVKPSTSFGTIKPKTVQHGERGDKLIWDIPELMQGEERIISYQVDSKITVLGSINLPVCMVRYKTVKGRVVNVKSNPVKLDLEKQ